jgi:glycine cleavage system pyridoxal-binding protein P
VTQVVEAGKARGMLVGVAAAGRRLQTMGDERDLVIAVTEKRTRHDMDALVDLFAGVTA